MTVLLDLGILAVALVLVGQGALLATRYAAFLAESLHLSKYAVGFIIVAVISILPETFIALNAAFHGVPSFGLGTLLGSNVADLTLVFVLLVFFARRGLIIESKVLTHHVVYPFVLLLPLILGGNGHFSRLDGLALILTGCVFYYLALRGDTDGTVPLPRRRGRARHIALLGVSMGVLLVGSYFTVTSATALAGHLSVSPILIGLLVVGLGTTIPELFFSLRSVKKGDDSLAVGDILGTVLADATVVVGILALVHPFAFPVRIIYITGTFMVAASYILFRCMRSGRVLTQGEAYILLAFWATFVVVEFVSQTL